MSGLDTAISNLVTRLESVASRLEKVEHQLASGQGAGAGASASASSSAGGASGASSASVQDYEALVNTHLRPWVTKSGAIAPEVQQQAELFVKACEAQKAFLVVAASSKKPSDTVLQTLIKPTADLMAEVVALKDKNRTSKFTNNLSTVSEGVGALGWILEALPQPHVGNMRGGSEFYSNRLLKDFKGKDENQVGWVSNYNTFLKELQAYIKTYHTAGLSWNAQGGDASASASAAPAPAAAAKPAAPAASAPAPAKPAAGGAKVSDLFGSLNKGEGVTSGLKKVTNDMKTKNMEGRSAVVPASAAKPVETAKTALPKKPAKMELDGNKWIVENFVDRKDLVITDTESRHVVYIYGLINSTVQIKGKVNSIAIDNCKRTAVVFENAISGVEVVNGTSIEVQVTGRVPSVAIDKTSGIQLYLSKESIEAEIVTSKSSEMNVLLPAAEAGGDLVEFPLPEQYKTLIKPGNKLVTECVQHSG